MGFRKDFIWGSATASYQIEGAWNEAGRGLSVWDVFCHEKGNVAEEHTGDIACDHYHRFREDVRLMRELGIKAYRFSISWTRIFPKGTGEINEEGIRFYSELLDELIANGIEPYITLFHWDYPYELHCKGGWLNDESVMWFADYAAKIAKLYSDRCKNFITLFYNITRFYPGNTSSCKDTCDLFNYISSVFIFYCYNILFIFNISLG